VAGAALAGRHPLRGGRRRDRRDLAGRAGGNPPVAKILPSLIEAHGHRRTDNYDWLRDEDDPDTLAYLVHAQRSSTYPAPPSRKRKFSEPPPTVA
jgi:hypothetical protein